MTEPTVRVEGIDRLVRTLNKAKADLSDLKDANAAVGNLIAREAVSTAPHRSGKLAGTIRASRQARRAQVVIGRAAVPYAGPIHWGWPARGIAANPWASEAAQDTESRWVPIYLKDVQAALNNVRGA